MWGVWAVLALCVCRFVQGIGLGGEWSGAALVATENAPANKRALYGSFPELGAPIGFFLCNGTYVLLELFNDDAAMLAWGWRVPFLLSSLLVVVGLLVRVHMEETPAFRAAKQDQRVVKAPALEVFRTSWRQVLQATFLVAVTYTLFYTLGHMVARMGHEERCAGRRWTRLLHQGVHDDASWSPSACSPCSSCSPACLQTALAAVA